MSDPVTPGTSVTTTGALVPALSKAQRTLSRDVADFPMPTGREEEWRFTPLDRLRGLLDGTATTDGGFSVAWDGPSGATIGRVPRNDPRVGSAFLPSDRAAAIALARVAEPLLVNVPAHTELDAPVRITVKGEGGTSYGHLVVEVGAFARATVVLDHVGTGFFSANVECLVGDGASLTFVSLQDWDRDAVHLGHHVVRVGRDATFRGFAVTLGGDVVRLAPSITYAGSGGDAELYGLFFADEGQHLEHRVFVDHTEPHCRSRVVYKGALQGAEAHAVWIGDVFIGKDAVGTDTYELNRNLVLTDGARADSVPNLEIETGEVAGAGHASATGRFDDLQLFYLQSRGIAADEARRLVVRGFFAEVIDRIDVPELRDRLVQAVDDELAGAVL
ncbi:MAG TPA: Fe-S cluster assembly protein SufD [Mycobacteriales bacterium]|nr:Fe-S cluster assembly protein SufD [Mycobacteriales bacterium]